MIQNFYTLPDLVDLALKVPEIGSVNFNILHTVLQTLIAELRLHNVRPLCHIENPLLAKSALTKAKLKGEAAAKDFGSDEAVKFERPQPQTPPQAAKPKVEEATSNLEEKETKDPELPITKEETVSEETERASSKESAKDVSPDETSHQTTEETIKVPEEKEHKEKIESPEEKPEPEEETAKSRREAAGWDDVSQEIRTHRKSLHVEDESKTTTAKDLRQVRDAWRYTNLDTRITATEEGMMRLTDIIDMITDRIKKSEARRKPGGISAEELEGLEERVEELEEAKIVFDEDHVNLSEVKKTQKEMVEEFEEIRALGGAIKEMKVEISSKADLEEMEEALALKGDLELVLTKVDQTEFETAIEELGEAIGLLGIKFQKKNDEWEERAADIWRAIDGKMSRDIFDEAVLKINSRLTALMYGLKKIKKVVEDLLYPDASGVTRCIVCRRPAGISGHECFDPEIICNRSGNSSDDSDDKESFLKSIGDALAKRHKHDGPPFSSSRDTIISVPFSSTTHRSSPEESFPSTKVNLRVAPINEKTNHRESEDRKRRSQIPKLPQINKQTQDIQFSVPKVRVKQQHRDLIFTKKMLSRLQRGGNLPTSTKHYQPEMEAEPPFARQSPLSTPSKESKISASTDIMSDSAGNLQSFAPMRLMQDPLRREIILSPPDANHKYKPTMILAPLSSGASSYQDSSATL